MNSSEHNRQKKPEISNIDQAVGTSINGTVVPGRSTQSIHTTVEMEDGQTLVLGGLIQNTVQATTRKLPILGDLPFLGVAFSSKDFREEEDELVVMITPHVVDPMSCDQLPKYLPGQETRSPDNFELFLEGILEAPRGQREVCPDNRYLPAYRNGPSADVFPCGDNNGRRCGGCNTNGNCSQASPLTGAAVDTVSTDKAKTQIRPAGNVSMKPEGQGSGVQGAELPSWTDISSSPAASDGSPVRMPGPAQTKDDKPMELPVIESTAPGGGK